MSKEEPAWKAEALEQIADLFRMKDGQPPEWIASTQTARSVGEAVLSVMAPHILAAEQRGFQAGVNKTGDSVGKLREQLKTARADARREAAAEIRYPWKVGEFSSDQRAALFEAADFIDPDKS